MYKHLALCTNRPTVMPKTNMENRARPHPHNDSDSVPIANASLDVAVRYCCMLCLHRASRMLFSCGREVLSTR